MASSLLLPLNKSRLQVIGALQHAATDEQAHGFVAQIDQMGNQDLVSCLAGNTMQELHAAILRFRYVSDSSLVTQLAIMHREPAVDTALSRRLPT